jgi:hypothetical protein
MLVVRCGEMRSRCRFGEPHGYGIHAVAQACGAGAVVEDVAEVRVAKAAGNGGADHA